METFDMVLNHDSPYRIRVERFKNFVDRTNLTPISDLIATHRISEKKFSSLKASLLSYFRKVTNQHSIEESNFESSEVFNTKNITPNGALVPKSEYEVEYNEALSAYYSIISDIFEDKSLFCKLHFPVNFRLKTGIPDPRNENRGLNTAIPHSDAWVGEESDGFNFYLPVLGDISRNRLRYYEIEEAELFGEDWLSPVASYNDHLEVIKQYRPNDSIIPKPGFLYISDFSIIHQTFLDTGAGNRISCDSGYWITDRITEVQDHEDRRNEYIFSIPQIPETHWVDCLVSENSPHGSKPSHFSHYTKSSIRLVTKDATDK